MTRKEYIEAVKAKLEEISPFEEPTTFIAADGDSDYANVKPIISYIDGTLDEATRNCLRALPLTLLHSDIETTTPSISIAADGVATFNISTDERYVRFRHPELKRDITSFITTEDSLYLLQQNKYTRGGLAKPVAVVSSDVTSGIGKMEIYSLEKRSSSRTDTTNGRLLKININKKVGVAADYTGVTPATALVQSPISELVVLECAAMVADILGDVNAAQVIRQEQLTKVQAVLQ